MKYLVLIALFLSSGAIAQTPNPTPFDGRISGTVVDANGKPISEATVVAVQESLLSIIDAYPVQVQTDLRGNFDFGSTLKHGVYDIYARKEKDGYPDRSLAFYKPLDFQPQTVQLFGSEPEAKIEVKLGELAGVLSGRVVDGDTDEPLDASLNLVDMETSDVSSTVNGKHAEIKEGIFRELVPANTDVYVYVEKSVPRGNPAWSHFTLKINIQPGEERRLDIRLYKSPSS